MKSLEKILDSVMRFLMALSMFILVAFGTWQIFSRWVLKDPSTFTDELLRYVLIIAGMIGSAYCFYRDEHLALTLVSDKAKGTFKFILNIFIEACILFFVVYVFIYGGWKLSATATNVSSVMRIPMKTLYLIEPLCGIMIVIARVLKYLQAFSKGGENS
ncbi:MAG: TRAP transporter small permease [Synergistaceae bacterium]|nr:TRAP transporter small permease [Synergistaceae bacterium]MBQ9595285.1 TRAP transporter small permease [Synergistaceae bacterium]MBR0204813.1 TRAP transporter small permease [Synergistaceae bacterium]